MAIKVIIERRVKKGLDTDLAKLMRELRAKAILAKGYISGETLRACDDPGLYLVISTWKSLDDWRAWEDNPVRKELQAKVDAILKTPTMRRVFDFA